MLLQPSPAITALSAPAETTRDQRPQQALAARALVFVIASVLVVLPVGGMVFRQDGMLTWIAAVDCGIVIPLATVALIRVTRPRWARSAADGTSLGTVLT